MGGTHFPWQHHWWHCMWYMYINLIHPFACIYICVESVPIVPCWSIFTVPSFMVYNNLCELHCVCQQQIRSGLIVSYKWHIHGTWLYLQCDSPRDHLTSIFCTATWRTRPSGSPWGSGMQLSLMLFNTSGQGDQSVAGWLILYLEYINLLWLILSLFYSHINCVNLQVLAKSYLFTILKACSSLCIHFSWQLYSERKFTYICTCISAYTIYIYFILYYQSGRCDILRLIIQTVV